MNLEKKSEYLDKARLISELAKLLAVDERTIYRYLSETKNLKHNNPPQEQGDLLMENTLIDWIEDPVEERGEKLIKRAYTPYSYLMWERFKNHRGNKILGDKLPFFSYEQLDLPSTLPKFSPQKLMRTRVHPAFKTSIISPQQIIKIDMDGDEELIRYMTAQDLLAIRDYLIEKYDYISDEMFEMRQNALSSILVPEKSDFEFELPSMGVADFMLQFIRFGTEVLSRSTSMYIEEKASGFKFSIHCFYDFLLYFGNKELKDLGIFSVQGVSAYSKLSIEYFKRFHASNCNVDEMRKVFTNKRRK